MVFADSSGLVAAFWPRDPHHQAAIGAWRALAARRQRILTTDLVFAETVTLLRRWAGYDASRQAGEALLRSHNIDVVGLEREALQAAWREFVRSGDPKFSLCDAMSITVMRERRAVAAFTFDRHFRDAGLATIP